MTSEPNVHAARRASRQYGQDHKHLWLNACWLDIKLTGKSCKKFIFNIYESTTNFS